MKKSCATKILNPDKIKCKYEIQVREIRDKKIVKTKAFQLLFLKETKLEKVVDMLNKVCK